MSKAASKPKKARRVSSNDARIEKLLRDLSADLRFIPIVKEFVDRATIAPRKFGSNGLKVNGKLFVLFTQGTLVVKLRPARVSILVAEGAGQQFDPGHGRLMKGWLTVTNPQASWLDLVKEAFDFVSAGK
jgi:hypothetical protein